MQKVKRTPAGDALTDLMLDLFRANSLILTAGDRLVVHVETQGGPSAAYVVDPRNGALLGTVEFPPGAGR